MLTSRAPAVTVHGRVRATSDFDVLVEPTKENAGRLERAIREFVGTSLEYFGVSAAEG